MFNELLTEIESIPAIDVCSHIDAAAPVARDLSRMALCSDMREELIAAGVSPEIFETPEPGKALKEAWPRLEKLQNTTAYWCLTQIVQDLLEVDSLPHQASVDELSARVESYSADGSRPATVLDRAHVAKSLFACEWYREIPAASDRLAPTVRLDLLINEPFTRKVLDKLSEITDQTVYEVGDLYKAIANLLRQAKSKGTAAVNASFAPQVDFEPGSRDSADRILSLVLLGQKTDRDDRRALRSYVMDQVLRACAEYGLTFQLMLGSRKAADERVISAFDSGMVAGYASLFSRHPGVKFDVFTSHMTLAHEFAAAARSYTNVYVSGAWQLTAIPVHIRDIIRERIEMLPITRSCALASAASCVEWVYARSSLIRRELAFVLTDMVKENYISRGAAVDIARHYLHDNPMRIYNLC